MAEHKKVQTPDDASSFAKFVHETVEPLSKVFAASELMQLRVKTPQGSVTLTKAPLSAQAPIVHQFTGEAGEVPRAPGRAAAPRVYNGEAGRTYDTINAEVVGIFRDLPEPPPSGDRLEAGQLLGHIEALRLRNEVRCPLACTLIAQVVVDGQPVDFGEALFVVDSGGKPLIAAADEAESTSEPAEPAEPPRI